MGGYARSYFSAYWNLESVHRFNNRKPKDRLLHNWPGTNAFRYNLEGSFGDEQREFRSIEKRSYSYIWGMEIRLSSLLIVLSFIVFGCSEKEPDPFVNNQQMVDLLNERHFAISPTDITYYFNAERARALDSIRHNYPEFSDEHISHSYWYFRETLNAGDTEKSIELINTFFDDLKANEKELSQQWNYFYQRLLALSYIRLGEQENCQINHSSSSCILPISNDGVHQLTGGSTKAIEIIEPLLKDYPEDLELVWLLNICYQTLGLYPESVPKDFLIPPSSFVNENSSVGRFIDMAPELGLGVMGIAGGSIMDDFNNDGYPDIVASSSGIKNSDQLHYFVNNGDGSFTDNTEQAALNGLVGGLNCVQTDYNNDGLTDIFVMRGGWFGRWGQHPNSLLKNNGDGTFTDVTEASGLLSFHPTQTATWRDFNNDGWLDVFIGNESTATNARTRAGRGKVHEAELYINQGDGTFKDVASDLGLNFKGLIKGVTAFDFNNDGLQDIYISIMGSNNILLQNKGDLKFEDVAQTAGVQEPVVSFSTGTFDFDNDGFEDLYVGAYTTSNNPLSHEIAFEAFGNQANAALPNLYKNNGDGTFTDVTTKTGLDHSIYSMGFNFGDLDNDGFLDLYFGTGDPNLESIIPNRMFKNIDGNSFTEVSYAGGFSNIQKGHGISWGDIDADGDEDIYITMGGAHEGDSYQNQLLINPTESSTWVNLKLVGSENKKAIGSKVKITTNKGQEIFRTVSSGASFGGNSFNVEAGLNSANEIEQLSILWAGETAWTDYGKQKINKHLKIDQETNSVEEITLSPLVLKHSANSTQHHE